jgi:hypothetical protein
MRLLLDLKKFARTTLAVAALLALGDAALAQGLTMSDLRKLGANANTTQVDGVGLTRAGEGAYLRAIVATTGTTNTRDFSLSSALTSANLADRVEMSLGSQNFRSSLAPLGRFGVREDVLGLKLRLAGYGAAAETDSAMPLISIGALYKRNRNVGDVPGLDARRFDLRDERSVDYYVSASKSLMNQSLQLNTTLRATRASQAGLLGFGPGNTDSYQAMLETSATYSISRKLVVGAEFRLKPTSVGLDNDKAYSDLFLAYFPTKNLALTLAYASLGDITVFNPKRQSGAYMSLQLGF